MSGSVKQVSKTSDVDERASALTTNSSAVAALASAVEGTLGPKGLDCMLVDKFGDVTITNDGATILDKIDTAHPAARMLVRAARAQEDEIGDGTTTTAILASALISEAANHVARGVPVAKLIEGIRHGITAAREAIRSCSSPITSLADDRLDRVALIAARGQADIAELVATAARLVGDQAFAQKAFRLADAVIAKEGADSEVFEGVVIEKQRLNRQMPSRVQKPKALVVDDALEPPSVEDDALTTEAGFARHLALQEEFRADVERIIDLGVRFVAVAKAVDPAAEELLTDAGVFCVRRLSARDIYRVAELTGARTIKRSGLKRSAQELEQALGGCREVVEDEKLDHVRVIGEPGKGVATVLVGASTREVKDERERMARDAAGALQAAFNSGVVPGGGAVEIAASRALQAQREGVRGMAGYGVDCVIAALKRPLAQIVANAGFNPLEKVEDAVAAQSDSGSSALAVDTDSGEIADMLALGVVDPTGVKVYALLTAAEIAVAILRINTIIRKREDSPAPQTAGREPQQTERME